MTWALTRFPLRWVSALVENFKLGSMWITAMNMLDYFLMVLIIAMKSLMVKVPEEAWRSDFEEKLKRLTW
jgi:hypothetical protein